MAERAHPNDPAFQDKWHLVWRRKFIPWLRREKSPYRAAFLWRYKWVNKVCIGKDVLDIPCGMGWGTSLIRGARTIRGFDLNSDAITEARKKYGQCAEFSIGNMAQLNLPDSSLDVVCCLEGIEHVPQELGISFLEEVRRVLRVGGLLMISSPYCSHRSHSGNPHHIYEYQPDEIKVIIKNLFDIEETIIRQVDIMTVLYMKCRRHH